MAPLISLATDFGTRDGYVGALKGVLSRLAPGVPLIDVAHDIEPWDLVGAVLALRNALPHFPPGSVHCVVVDPGVGSERRGLIVASRGHLLVGPDNGILASIFPAAESTFHAIRAEHFAEVSATFHGRDVFAPVAAELATGRPVAELAEAIESPVRLRLPVASRAGNLVKGEVIHVDRYGNLITNIPAGVLDSSRHIAVSINRKPVRAGRTFADVAPGDPVSYWGSGGLLEVGVREGSAREMFGGRGLPVEVVRYG